MLAWILKTLFRAGHSKQRVDTQDAHTQSESILHTNDISDTTNEKANLESTLELEKLNQFLETPFKSVFVTGGAGTGKSTFVRNFRANAQQTIPVLAPTGIAALNVEGQTIHSFFHLPFGPIDVKELEPIRNRRLFEFLHTIIIDEVSMVRADIMDAIDDRLRKCRAEPDKQFGGVRIIFVGDLAQLPPVVNNRQEELFLRSKYKTNFFLSAQSVRKDLPKTFLLTKTFRQTEEEFIQFLWKIRVGEDPESTINYFNLNCYKPDEFGFIEEIILTPENARADRINAEKMANLPGSERVFKASVTGDFNIEDERVPSPFYLKIKIGTRVMFTKNDTGKRWVNGTMGIVAVLSEDWIEVKVNQASYKVRREEWESMKFRFDSESGQIEKRCVGIYRQFPLTPAWAVTIHKSQGKTFEALKIDISNGAFAPGQLYVALSRSRTLGGIRLSRQLSPSDVIVDPVVVDFYKPNA